MHVRSETTKNGILTPSHTAARVGKMALLSLLFTEQPEAPTAAQPAGICPGSAGFQPAHAVDFMLLKRLLGIDVVCDSKRS